MKIFSIIFLTLLLSGIVAADDMAIKIFSPQRNETLNGPEVDFNFEVEADNDAESCSLFVNNHIMKTYPTVQKRMNRVFTVELQDGYYEWRIQCTILGEEVTSETRRLQIMNPSGESGCVEKISRGSGRFRNVFDLECIQEEPITINALRPNDWIEITLSTEGRDGGGFESTDNYFIIYMIKLSKINSQDYLQFNTNKNSIKTNLFVGDSASLDVDGDDTDDISMTLDSIETKKATVTIDLINANYFTEPEEIVDEESVDEEEIIIEDIEIDDTEPLRPITEDKEPEIVEETDSRGKFWGTIIIILILLGVLAYIMFAKKDKPAPKRTKKADFMLEKTTKKPKRKKRRKKS